MFEVKEVCFSWLKFEEKIHKNFEDRYTLKVEVEVYRQQYSSLKTF